MSKRKSQTAVADYRTQGYVREALVNHLALLGWSSGGDEEVFALEDLVDRFELERVQSSGAIFDAERLAWLNGQWIRMLPTDELVERALPFLVADVERAAAAGARTRTPTADDLAALLPMVRRAAAATRRHRTDARLRVHRRHRAGAGGPRARSAGTRRRPRSALEAAADAIERLGELAFEADELEPALRALAEERGWKPGDLFMAVRVAITGPHRDAAAVRHDGRDRLRAHARPPARSAQARLDEVRE